MNALVTDASGFAHWPTRDGQLASTAGADKFDSIPHYDDQKDSAVPECNA